MASAFTTLIGPATFSPITIPGIPPNTITMTVTNGASALADYQINLADYNLHTFVDNTLRQQLIKAIHHHYIDILINPLHGFSRVTTCNILTHIWTNYGIITPAEIQSNSLAIIHHYGTRLIRSNHYSQAFKQWLTSLRLPSPTSNKEIHWHATESKSTVLFKRTNTAVKRESRNNNRTKGHCRVSLILFLLLLRMHRELEILLYFLRILAHWFYRKTTKNLIIKLRSLFYSEWSTCN